MDVCDAYTVTLILNLQVISLLIHLAAHLMVAIRLRRDLMGPSIQRDPVKLFRIMTTSAYFMANINFTKVCLSPTEGFKSLLITAKSYSSDSSKSKPSLRVRGHSYVIT